MYRVHCVKQLCLCALIFATLPIVAFAQDVATWTDSSGKFKIRASFVRMDGQNVVLKKEDGSEIKVPLTKLSSASQQLAKGAKSKAPTAPATKSSSSPATAATFRDNMTIEEYAAFLQSRAEAKDFSFVWDTLPASYQEDVQSLIVLLGEKLDPKLYEATLATKVQLINILKKQKKFVLATQVVPIFKDPKSIKAYDPAISAIDTVLALELFSPEQLKKGDVKAIASAYIAKVVPAVEVLNAQLKEAGIVQATPASLTDGFSYTAKSISSDKAEVTFSGKDQPDQTQTFVRVEGRWVPEDLATNWNKNIAKIRENLEQLTEASQAEALAGLNVFQAQYLNALSNAKTQEEFDTIIAPLGMLGMMMTSGMNGGMPMAPGGAPPAFGPGFGEEPRLGDE